LVILAQVAPTLMHMLEDLRHVGEKAEFKKMLV